MAPSVIAGLIGLALLAILTPIAIRDRRNGSNDFSPPEDPFVHGPSAIPLPTAATQPITVGKIAFGVFLGIWLFVISIALPTMLMVKHYTDQWNGR